ncbi:MAG: GGDEF domain-containing protein [Clostridia bacterium]|nr:GGDEF domain-containing protein [Clostridia bacterium]
MRKREKAQKTQKTRISYASLFYTGVALIMLVVVLFSMVFFMVQHTEEEAYSNLRVQTESLKSNINLQMISDRENLLTMASFASKLYADGESYALLFDSFEEIGLLESVGILSPDGTFTTKAGVSDASAYLSFEEEAKKGEYISGRIKDITNPDVEIVRSAVPVVSGGETVAMLYGAVDLQKLENFFGEKAKMQEADLLIIEGTSGNYIADTRNDELGNVTGVASAEFQDGFSFDRLLTDITEGNSGYASFRSMTMSEFYYTYYTDLSFSDWRILMGKPESVVFAKAHNTVTFIFLIVLLVFAIVATYVALIFRKERKKSAKKHCASDMRKLLLQFNNRAESIQLALKQFTDFVNARSTFFLDTLGESYIYIRPDKADQLLDKEERKQLIAKLMSYAAVQNVAPGGDVLVYRIRIDRRFLKDNPAFYNFAKRHFIKKISFAIVNNQDVTGFVGTINAKSHDEVILLRDVAVCFSLAVYNKKHLDKTEKMALTDPLTAMANRMAYNNDIRPYEEVAPKGLCCVYIDVNELHYFNNTYGHAAGDRMLKYIGEVIRLKFPEGKTYRMGGDEFLVIDAHVSQAEAEARMQAATAQIEEMKYHISVGIATGTGECGMEELVTDAEKIMYEDKARYYQRKSQQRNIKSEGSVVEHLKTGIHAVDAALEVATRRYYGIYCVSLKTDKAEPLLIPSYLKPYSDRDENFSEIYARYVRENVKPEYHRAMLEFMRYDKLKNQLDEEYLPSVIYEKVDGNKVCLSICAIPKEKDTDADTMWTFERL